MIRAGQEIYGKRCAEQLDQTNVHSAKQKDVRRNRLGHPEQNLEVLRGALRRRQIMDSATRSKSELFWTRKEF